MKFKFSKEAAVEAAGRQQWQPGEYATIIYSNDISINEERATVSITPIFKVKSDPDDATSVVGMGEKFFLTLPVISDDEEKFRARMEKEHGKNVSLDDLDDEDDYQDMERYQKAANMRNMNNRTVTQLLQAVFPDRFPEAPVYNKSKKTWELDDETVSKDEAKKRQDEIAELTGQICAELLDDPTLLVGAEQCVKVVKRDGSDFLNLKEIRAEPGDWDLRTKPGV